MKSLKELIAKGNTTKGNASAELAAKARKTQFDALSKARQMNKSHNTYRSSKLKNFARGGFRYV